jgi:outer membrane protein assembly factor BamA
MKTGMSRSMKIHTLKVYGTKATKADVIEREVQTALKATTFGEIVEEMQKTCYRLSRLGIFESMDVYFDTPKWTKEEKATMKEKEEIPRHQVDVVLTLEEKPRIWGQTGTTVGYNEGGIVSI